MSLSYTREDLVRKPERGMRQKLRALLRRAGMKGKIKTRHQRHGNLVAYVEPEMFYKFQDLEFDLPPLIYIDGCPAEVQMIPQGVLTDG
jgi:hypothetical protein